MTLRIEDARAFARKKHEGQTRVNEHGETVPYFDHCEGVAKLVRAAGGTDEQVMAAYLHDVIEDCGVDVGEVIQYFGTEVASLVLELTDVYTHDRYPDLNRKLRKELEVQRKARLSPAAMLIKFCDVLHNSMSIENKPGGSDFAKVYRGEINEFLTRVMGSASV